MKHAFILWGRPTDNRGAPSAPGGYRQRSTDIWRVVEQVTAKRNFVRQQGFKDASPDACVRRYPALMWQPRPIGILVLVGLVFQAWPYSLALYC
jgi:hypothetical protein